MSLTEQQEELLAKQFGFYDGPPEPRREQLQNDPLPKGVCPNFYRAVALVDRLLTVRFWNFVPDFIEVDQSESSETYWDQERTWAVLVRTDVPPPITEKDQNWSGIFYRGHPEAKTTDNYFRWLKLELGNHAWRIGCYRISPPLVYVSPGDTHVMRGKPYMGVLANFFRKKQDGRTLQEFEAQAAVLVPWDSPADPSQRVGGAIAVNNDHPDLTEIATRPDNLLTKE